MSNVWDNVVASASKAVTQAGEATQTAATKAKLHADILLIDRDIQARKEKFGVDMYTHLEGITSTQEFYVADDRLINVIRPTLIKAQKEVAAYERKRDTMKGKVNMAESNRAGSASILNAETIGQKFLNAVNFASAGAKEVSLRTELAMVERQILGFKEEFGTELYPIFQSMEDNEGWLPTDRKVRSLYDAAREDIAGMEKAKQLKREQIQNVGGADGSGSGFGFVPPRPPVVATPTTAPAPGPAVNNYQTGNGQTPWASVTATTPSTAAASANYGSSYGAYQSDSSYGTNQAPSSNSYGAPQQTYGAPQPSVQNSFGTADQMQPHLQQPSNGHASGFGFMQTQHPAMHSSTQAQGGIVSNNSFQQHDTQQQQSSAPSSGNAFNASSVFDPFDGIGSKNIQNAGSFFGASHSNQPPASANSFDPFSGSHQNSGNATKLSDADMNLFKY